MVVGETGILKVKKQNHWFDVKKEISVYFPQVLPAAAWNEKQEIRC